MTDKLRELLEDVRTDYYEGSGMAVYPNSFTKLRDEITELDNTCRLQNEQIEKMKADVRGNIRWADINKNDQMYCKLNAMLNQWEVNDV